MSAMTLTEFLLARIAEDAREASMDLPHRIGCARIPRSITYLGPCDCGRPARVLAECEAKRRIVEMFPHAADGDGWNNAGEGVLALLALPYADHPDYDEDWRP